jgi:CCR4-NOT transcriptional complex subunit CAF120
MLLSQKYLLLMMAEESSCELDEFQRQALDQMQKSGGSSIYNQQQQQQLQQQGQFPPMSPMMTGMNPYRYGYPMLNPMMTGMMNPMMTGAMYPAYDPQHKFAAQQAMQAFAGGQRGGSQQKSTGKGAAFEPDE